MEDQLGLPIKDNDPAFLQEAQLLTTKRVEEVFIISQVFPRSASQNKTFRNNEASLILQKFLFLRFPPGEPTSVYLRL